MNNKEKAGLDQIVADLKPAGFGEDAARRLIGRVYELHFGIPHPAMPERSEMSWGGIQEEMDEWRYDIEGIEITPSDRRSVRRRIKDQAEQKPIKGKWAGFERYSYDPEFPQQYDDYVASFTTTRRTDKHGGPHRISIYMVIFEVLNAWGGQRPTFGQLNPHARISEHPATGAIVSLCAFLHPAFDEDQVQEVIEHLRHQPDPEAKLREVLAPIMHWYAAEYEKGRGI